MHLVTEMQKEEKHVKLSKINFFNMIYFRNDLLH